MKMDWSILRTQYLTNPFSCYFPILRTHRTRSIYGLDWTKFGSAPVVDSKSNEEIGHFSPSPIRWVGPWPGRHWVTGSITRHMGVGLNLEPWSTWCHDPQPLIRPPGFGSGNRPVGQGRSGRDFEGSPCLQYRCELGNIPLLGTVDAECWLPFTRIQDI